MPFDSESLFFLLNTPESPALSAPFSQCHDGESDSLSGHGCILAIVGRLSFLSALKYHLTPATYVRALMMLYDTSNPLLPFRGIFAASGLIPAPFIFCLNCNDTYNTLSLSEELLRLRSSLFESSAVLHGCTFPEAIPLAERSQTLLTQLAMLARIADGSLAEVMKWVRLSFCL